jgi:hypothetical protein
VRAAVRKDSGNKQVPWESTSLEGDFIFKALPPVQAVSANPALVRAGQQQKIESIAAPQLKVGDTWNFQLIDMISGSVTEKFTRRLTRTAADEYHFGGYITDRSLNLLRRVRDGQTTTTWSPRRPNHEFPLQPGKTWSSAGTVDNDRLTSEHAFSFRVVRQEQVIVPAGVFDTLRVEGQSKYKTKMKTNASGGEGTSTHRYWFSAAAGNIVAYEYEETNFKGVVYKKERTELLSYKRDDRN